MSDDYPARGGVRRERVPRWHPGGGEGGARALFLQGEKTCRSDAVQCGKLHASQFYLRH